MDYGLCPLCGGELDSDGEWISCVSCEQEWYEEDFINKYLRNNNEE